MDFSAGEYFVSLKGYKIPLKSPDKTVQIAINNPPPPGTEGTEDELPLKNEKDAFVSPLAAVKRPPQPRFEIPVNTAVPATTQIQGTSTSPMPSKRSSLFSKLKSK